MDIDPVYATTERGTQSRARRGRIVKDTDDPRDIWDMPADDRMTWRDDVRAFGIVALGVVLVLIAVVAVTA